MKTSSTKKQWRRPIRAALKSASILFALAAVLLAGFAAPATAAKYTMTIAHIYPDDITNNEAAPSLERFRQLVESSTNGNVEVKIFGGGALGNEVETGKQAQLGKTIQSVLVSSGAASSFYKNYQIVVTPFLFPNYKTAWAFFDSPWFANFMKPMRKQSGLRYLGTFDDGGGFVAFTNNKRLIKTVADIKGLRIRVEENPAHITMMKSLGASATPLPWGEVQTALATGLADGQFNAPGVNDMFKLADVTKYTTWSGHVYNSVTWMVSEAWFTKLPLDYQKAIVRASREAVAIGHGIATHISIVGWVNSCKNFTACYILPDAEKDKMRAMARPAYKKWITTDFGVKARDVDALWAEVDRIAAELDKTWMDSYLK